MDTFAIGGNLFMMNCDFAFIILLSLKLDISLQFNVCHTDSQMGQIGNPILILIFWTGRY